MIHFEALARFANESNLIENIVGLEYTMVHTRALERLLNAERMLIIADVDEFVRDVQPNARFRNRLGLDVYVGNHRPIPGGPDVQQQMAMLLQDIGLNRRSPYECHQTYETLHPYTDGNGRSGRALWLWQMHKYHGYKGERLFLHQWYYDSLDNSR